MAYTTREKIEALIPSNFLERGIMIEGQEESGLLDSIISVAAMEIDGFLASRYSVPFVAPIHPFIATASIIITCDLVYKRNAVNDENNPWAERADKIRNQLQDLSDGVSTLDAATSVAAGIFNSVCLKFDKS